jgi:hypothetical protein
MCFIVSFFPATFWAVVGFFVLLGASKAEGGIKTFGRVLGLWICVLAVLIPLGGLFISVAGLCPIEAMMERIYTSPAQ